MSNHENIGRDFDDIIIVSGATQVMDLTTKVLCNEGDTVICEEPSFIGSLNCFRSYGCKLKGVPVEADGMNVELLEQALKTTPNAKFIIPFLIFKIRRVLQCHLKREKNFMHLLSSTAL